MVLFHVFLSLLHDSFSNVFYHIKWICLLSISDWCVFTGVPGIHSGLFLMYFVIKLRPSFTGLLFLEGSYWVGSFTQNNCTCSCSGPSRSIAYWALTVLISQVGVVGSQGSCTLGSKLTRKEDLKFLFLLWKLKKKKRKRQNSCGADVSLDLSSSWRAWFFLVYPCSKAVGHVVSALGKSLSSKSLYCATPKPHSWLKWGYESVSS